MCVDLLINLKNFKRGARDGVYSQLGIITLYSASAVDIIFEGAD